MMAPLGFGSGSAQLHNGLQASTEAMAQVVHSLRAYEAPGGKLFRTKTAVSAIGDMRLVANSSDACTLDVAAPEGWHLTVPSFGTLQLTAEGNCYKAEPLRHALLLPDIARSTEKGAGASTIVTIDPVRLGDTMAIMSAGRPTGAVLDVQPHLIDNSARSGLNLAFQRILHLVDLGLADPGLCETLSVDTLIYRWTAEALLGQQPPFETALRGHKLDLVCDAIRASHDRPLNLTEMEQIAELSARGLQYAFMSRFGCTPMEWQRRERMLNARQRIIAARPGESLTDIAFSMGFSSLAAFSALYRKHFGESPSQTLAQR